MSYDAYAAYYGNGAYPTAPAPATDNLNAELATLRAENASLKAENASLKAENAALKASGASSTAAPAPAPGYVPPVPPPHFYPPPPHYGGGGYYPGYPGYPPGPPGPPGPPPPPRPVNPPLALNSDNRRGPKGANIAIFCIPNAFYDQQVYDLCKDYGNVIFCSVATHRDSGLSRGYAFVSYETVEEANVAIASLHNMVLEGRALRCELARSDRDGGGVSGAKPY